MSDGVELTETQLLAAAEIARAAGAAVVIHQVEGEGSQSHEPDVFVTAVGAAHGHRVSARGEVTPIGKTLPGVERT
jgi:uncharacterized protein (DUF849 family)